MARTTVFLVRHGEQERSTSHAIDSGLSSVGREQAERLGRRLSGMAFTHIHHSPLRRAAETAGVLADHLPEVPMHACDLVADRTPVPAPGRASDYPERYQSWLEQVPTAERDENAAGVRAAVAHFGVIGDTDRNELLVTHNFVIGWFVRHVLDAPTWRWLGLNQRNCALTVVRWQTGRPPALLSFNDVGHL